jgi:hypothetical protein
VLNIGETGEVSFSICSDKPTSGIEQEPGLQPLTTKPGKRIKPMHPHASALPIMLQGNVNRWTQSFNRQSWRIRLRKSPACG